MKFEDQRRIMVRDNLEARGISDVKVLAAFMKVPREEFVPDDFKMHSYADHPLSIGEGQTISQPYIVSLMLSLLELEPEHRVLEIGTGSGYQTALLAELVKEVYTVERIDPLLRRAKRTLTTMGYENIHFRVGDGTRGWEKAYPPVNEFDRIVVAAAAPKIPQPLLEQLAEGGRLVIPAGSRYVQELICITRQNGEFIQEKWGGCAFVPLVGEEGWQE